MKTWTNLQILVIVEIISGDNIFNLQINFFFLQFAHLIDNTIRIPIEESILFTRVSPQEENKQQKGQQPSLLLPENEDEDDVPTRAYLKRQAQLIVDAKSRRKFNRVLNFPRPRK